jgi:anti-sigma regulatory factor (Ser/Thr protein kinase)
MAGLVNRATERAQTTAIVLTSAAAMFAALVAGAIAGGSAVAVAVGALCGLVIGGLAGAGLGSLPAGWPFPTGSPSPALGETDAQAGLADAETETPDASVRALVGDVLLGSIGHRFRGLADRQLATLQDLEREVGARTELTTVTRLAARIQRAATTLQVLADHPESHEAATTCTVQDVLRAAVADIEQQARVDFSSLHPATVDGEAVPDVVHLLAELIDNALTASDSHDTPVVVIGRKSSDGYVLSIVDEGPGLDEEGRLRAKNRLQATVVDWQLEAAFGLSTAGRLAARHGIAVTLLEAPTDGITAKVRLPSQLVGGRPFRPDMKGASPVTPSGSAGANDPRPALEPARATGTVASPEGHTEAPTEPPSASAEEPTATSTSEPTEVVRRLQRSRSNPREVTAVQREPAPPIGRRPVERKPADGAGEVRRGGVKPRPAGDEGRGKDDGSR